MSVHKLRNLISLRTRNLTQKVQRALQGLSEALCNERGNVQPQAIPVPIGNKGDRLSRAVGIRSFSTSTKCGQFTKNSLFNFPRFRYQGFRGFGACRSGPGFSGLGFMKFNISQYKFYHRPLKEGCIFNKLGKGCMTKSLSQAYSSSYRAKVFTQNVKLMYRTILCMGNVNFTSTKFPENRYNINIRLNASLSPKSHKLTLEMARTDSSASYKEKLASDQIINGCFIEFPINLNLEVPKQTVFNEDVLNAFVSDLTLVQTRIEELKKDLTKLFDLGEVPIEYVASKQVIRAYFPNCDKEKLESLCQEHGIVGGIVYEDTTSSASASESGDYLLSETNSVESDDILSSWLDDSYSLSSVSSISSFDSCSDVGSSSYIHPLSSSDIVRIDDGSTFTDEQEVGIISSDDFYFECA